jgi:hypothetical protein
LAIKTPCTHRCRRGEEKYIRQRVCAAAFGCNSCLGYCSSSSSSVCCVRLSVRALLRADGRSHQEPTVDPNSFLLTKKRYVGYSYESPEQMKPIFDAKGIETVRRDTCPTVAKILE